MLHATSSPNRVPVAPRPESTIRLRAAEELEQHLSEVESARLELERSRKRSSPLDRVLAISRAEMDRLMKDKTQRAIAKDIVAAAVDAVGNILTLPGLEEDEEGAAWLKRKDGRRNDVGGTDEQRDDNARNDERRNDSHDSRRNETAMVPSPLKRNNMADFAMTVSSLTTTQRNPGRYWRAAITSAAIRHGKVEYEIRSELTAIRTTMKDNMSSDVETVTGTCVVRRRYRDFDRLHRLMSLEIKDRDFVLMPRLPPKDVKSVVSGKRADSNFVWNRRIGLQLWLKFVCEHHVLRNSTLLREFLWEPEAAAVSNDKRFEDLNTKADLKLWDDSLQGQIYAMEKRFTNGMIALTSMSTHCTGLMKSYSMGSKCTAYASLVDASIGRRLDRLGHALSEWADFERDAGQNYTFVNKFALNLGAVDLKNRFAANNRMNASKWNATMAEVQDTSTLVSFSEKELRIVPRRSGNATLPDSATAASGAAGKSLVEPPKSIGATCDSRSLNAFQTLLHMWGDEILPDLHKNFVAPKELLKQKGSADRIACEWNESENLRREIICDGARRLVEEQIERANDEVNKWMALREVIRAQEIEISSLAALGDVGDEKIHYPTIRSAIGDLDSRAFRSNSGSSTSSASFLQAATANNPVVGTIDPTSSFMRGQYGGAKSPAESGDSDFPKLLNRSLGSLDENLDHAQERFKMVGDHLTLMDTSFLRTGVQPNSPLTDRLSNSSSVAPPSLEHDPQVKYLNPFYSDDE